ncbi:Hsp20/alpha crystallin family protein [Candidatus Uhrbacteria bacterium]|nr:Hsp20/alpha crystallin family protein [Candidatus Uhrbacteria bacterium]
MGLFSKKSSSAKNVPAMPPLFTDARQEGRHWSLFDEGQLLVDMYETDDMIVIRSFVAGVDPDHIEISMHNDMLTIRGTRQDMEEIHDDRFYHRECHWGTFSRSVIIPKTIDPDRIRALFKNGVVTILLPKAHPNEPSVSSS